MAEPQDAMPTSPSTGAGPRLSAILVTWNRARDLRRLLESLDGQTIRDAIEVIVFDNASTDDTLAMLREWPLPLRVIPHPRNDGPCMGRNVGIAVARAPLCLFIDTDAYLHEPDLCARLVAHMEGDATCRGATCIIYSDEAREKVWLTGGFMTRYALFDEVRSRTIRENPDWLSTCFCVHRTEELRAVGGFDPWYVYGYEDSDLGMRVRRRWGGAYWIDVDRSVVHLMSGEGRTRDWSHFHTMFKYFEFYRHYWVLQNAGFREMMRNILVLPFRRRDLWSTYWMKLTKWQWFLALGWCPAVNLVLLPFSLWNQRRDHVGAAMRRLRRLGVTLDAPDPRHLAPDGARTERAGATPLESQ